MHLSDFDFELPERLIAKFPAERRTDSRLLHLDAVTGAIRHLHFRDITGLMAPGDLAVFNDTRVVPARFFGKKETGGRVELLLERVLSPGLALMQIRASKSPKPGARIRLEGSAYELDVLERRDEFFEVGFPSPGVLSIADELGHMPLPPYIDRADHTIDRERYQTVFARRRGAVAAPTAGLHFDDNLLAALSAKGVDQQFITLHVGAGTFQPVRVEDIEDHQMHSEWADVSATVVEAARRCRQQQGRIVAVGTTAVRSLETAAAGGILQPFTGDTDIFIYPGYEFRSVDAMVTNFHLPGSTLIMLVSAFAGVENIRHAYEVAIEEAYRFFSYGDAMLITR